MNEVYTVVKDPMMGGPIDDNAGNRILYVGGVSWLRTCSTPVLITQIMTPSPFEDERTAKINLERDGTLCLSCSELTFIFVRNGEEYRYKATNGTVALSKDSSSLLFRLVEKYNKKKEHGPAVHQPKRIVTPCAK